MSPEDAHITAAHSKTLSLNEGQVSLDTDRQKRCGYPEVVYGEGKSLEAIASIFREQLSRGQSPFATRITLEVASSLLKEFPQAIWNETARTVRVGSSNEPMGKVAVITAGTTDLPVAEEASETLAWMGTIVTKINDVGVAGPHRLPSRLADFVDSDVIVVVGWYGRGFTKRRGWPCWMPGNCRPNQRRIRSQSRRSSGFARHDQQLCRKCCRRKH